MDQEPCLHGTSALRFPIGLVDYNITAQRTVYNAFANFSSQPAFNTSFFLFEGYSVKGVKDVPAASTAFPDRGDNLLMYVAFFFLLSFFLPLQKVGSHTGVDC